MSEHYPKGAPQPGADDTVQILTTEKMARDIEDYLGKHGIMLNGPVLFNADDLPTYMLGPVP